MELTIERVAFQKNEIKSHCEVNRSCIGTCITDIGQVIMTRGSAELTTKLVLLAISIETSFDIDRVMCTTGNGHCIGITYCCGYFQGACLVSNYPIQASNLNLQLDLRIDSQSDLRRRMFLNPDIYWIIYPAKMYNIAI